jgi:NADP-reducing hydrogenase subunit HndD
MVSVTIDGVTVKVKKNTSILEAAKAAAVKVPTLCFLKGINALGACRICLVEVKEGGSGLQAACTLPAAEGMVISTNSKTVQEARQVNLELILSNHDKRCLSCVRNGTCELQTLCEDMGIDDVHYEGANMDRPKDTGSASIVRDPNKCILCRRCVAMCGNIQKIGAVGTTQRGFNTIIEPVFGKSLEDVPCVNCGQCIISCPVGALSERNELTSVWDAIHDETKHVVVQTAPSVRFALGEEFGMPTGEGVTGKMANALRRIGFDKVFDTDFAADLTIVEEAAELIDRVSNGGKLPMITSCSPGWVTYCEHFFPDFLDNLSSCKSPHQMMGAVIKSYYAEQFKIDPKDIFVVSVMPCTAKKYEQEREEMAVNGLRDVDAVLTTRETARMIKQANIDFVNLPEADFDKVLGESSGAGVIFGATGGVMEAALRTVADKLTGENLDDIDYECIRGIAGVKEASLTIAGMDINVAVANGTGNAKKLLESVRDGKKQYHFIEVMGCPGGCVNGGGQPIVSASKRLEFDPRVVRAKSVYSEDVNKQKRKSHLNGEIQMLYDDYLGDENGHLAHELLHTHYHQKAKYK